MADKKNSHQASQSIGKLYLTK